MQGFSAATIQILHDQMKYVVLDVADLNTGVFSCWSVLEQRFKPGRSSEQQDFVCIKRFSFHEESHIGHILVVEEVRIETRGLLPLDLCEFWDGERPVALGEDHRQLLADHLVLAGSEDLEHEWQAVRDQLLRVLVLLDAAEVLEETLDQRPAVLHEAGTQGLQPGV